MTTAVKKVLEQALALSDEQRMKLIAALSDACEPPTASLSPQWKREIEDRLAQLESGEVEPVAWKQVEAKIQETLARYR